MDSSTSGLGGLYDFVRETLQGVGDDIQSAQSATLAMDAVLDTVRHAMADFAEGWNGRSTSSLSCLPNELQVACLEKLSFGDLVTCSHVSRRWRRLITQTPALWTLVPFTKRHYILVALMETVMLRSASVTLDVDRFFLRPEPHPGQSDDKARTCRKLRALLVAAMPRIRTLSIRLSNGCSTDPLLWQARAPMLESLLVEHTHCAQIPDLWWQSRFPRLKSLQMGVFSLPASPDPTNRLEVFQGRMCLTYESLFQTDARPLFIHFPHLVSLTLINVSNVSMLPETPPPPRLRYICLAGSPADGDVVPLLDVWRALPLETLNIYNFRHLSFADAADYFTSRRSGPWELKTDSSGTRLVFRTLPDRERLTFAVSLINTMAFGIDTPLPFHALQSLVISGRWIRSFLHAELDFPALTSLTVEDSLEYSQSWLQHVLEGQSCQCAALSAPSLRSVTLSGLHDEWASSYMMYDPTVRHFAQFVRERLRYDDARLQRITLAVPSAYVGGETWQDLCLLASEVLCEEGGVAVRVFRRSHAPDQASDSDDKVGDFQELSPLCT